MLQTRVFNSYIGVNANGVGLGKIGKLNVAYNERKEYAIN